MRKHITLTFILLGTIFSKSIYAQQDIQVLQQELGVIINKITAQEITVGAVKVDTIILENNLCTIKCNSNLADYPFRKDNVKQFYQATESFLDEKGLAYKEIQISTRERTIEQLIPNFYRSKKERNKTFTHKNTTPLMIKRSAVHQPKKGLMDRHLALWQSHGWYFEPKLDRWEWQRARIFQTVEDLYTQSFVLPYLVPMLESAGATVLLPRERDTQKEEIIVDNDRQTSSQYVERSRSKLWSTGGLEGFAHNREFYIDNQNPFREGTYRQVESIKKGEESTAEWIPNIPTSGEYAVYISYKTVKNSTDNARYTVHHNGLKSEFHINQQMGGGTWIYLGHFFFEKGLNPQNKISLSNLSTKNGAIITADAVKIGGGYGNIARKVSDNGTMPNSKSSDAFNQNVTENNTHRMNYEYQLSTYPRFTEAARYWMQWAGIPDSIYTLSKGVNDYTDDYQSRGHWVNYISGGSTANPEQEGLNIPIDLAFAFHSDAGTTPNDSIIGTLGIYRSGSHDGKLANGASRELARDLTDLIQSEIVNDIRTLYNPNWTRRGMWDKSYSEASTPKVPTMLLELLSHQNFADMRFGVDPRFKFTVSRSIYKGMLKYLSSQYNTDYIVQPLPVHNFSVEFDNQQKAKLSWLPQEDASEPTATPTSYIVYKKIGEGVFDQGTITKKNEFSTDIPSGVVCSFKVTAINDGGESFPSETLAIGKAIDSKAEVLVINGFTRISAPDDFDAQADSIAGFLDDIDHGVPYINDISYIGKMKEFRRQIPWMDDDASGFGDSYANYETMVIAGNTFNYPTLHGKSILKAGFSFTSASKAAVEAKVIDLTKYKVIDLVLGKEKQSKMGAGENKQVYFKTFSKALQQQLTAFTQAGGSIFASGAYIASDLWDNPLAQKQNEDIEFATKVLQYKWRVGRAATMGAIKTINSPLSSSKGDYQFYQTLNEESYVVESPDAIEPASKDGYTVMRYTENNLSAGVAYAGPYKTYIMGVPFEAIKGDTNRDKLMSYILDFLINK